MLYVYITPLIRHLKGELKKVIDQATQETSRRGWGPRAQRDRTKFRAKPNSADLVSTGKSG